MGLNIYGEGTYGETRGTGEVGIAVGAVGIAEEPERLSGEGGGETKGDGLPLDRTRERVGLPLTGDELEASEVSTIGGA